MRKVYNTIGFTKGYNFTLFFIFAGAMIGFVLARFQYLNYNDVFCGDDTQNFDCYFYDKNPVEKAGIIVHLAAILPAGFLVCFQFVPIIRRKAMVFHRLNGYLILLLSLVSTAGALSIARNSFGGGLDVQVAVGVIAMMFVGSLALAYYNVKRLQLEQHRAWMLRAWFYAGSIITDRIALIAMAFIASDRGQYTPISCDELASRYILGSREKTIAKFPQCEAYFGGISSQGMVAVEASFGLDNVPGIRAGLNSPFGAAVWLALFLHVVGIEVYLRLTPAESERLRNVSYQRQDEAGLETVGRAGLTADRIELAGLWVPASK